MSGFVLTDRAREELTAIYRYIAESSPQNADAVSYRFQTEMHKLARNPGLGHLRPEVIRDPVRLYNVSGYQIVYDPRTRPIRILMIVHGARDLPGLFEDE
ncbi:MAG: type II toxin-antitoxin system RelE/ParE family toxin [Phycisphaerales bacterium]